MRIQVMAVKTDGDLLRDARDDHAAFAEFVARHQLPLATYATRRLGSSHAEDIVNETFAVAYQRRDRFDPTRGEARVWLFGIATNLIRRHARLEAKTLRAYARTGVDPVAAHDAEGPAIDAVVAGALAALRPEFRDVLFLHAVAELSHDEIAVAMGIPVGTARGWLSKARTAAATEIGKRAGGAIDPTPHGVEP